MAKRIPQWKKEVRRFKRELKKDFKKWPLKKSALFLVMLFGWINMLLPAGAGFTGSYFSDTETMASTMTAGTWGITPDVVLNEILPDPIGNDNASMPGGEWVELYNNTNNDIDVAGWYLYDNNDAHMLAVTSANTNTGGTIVASAGFLVVYRNGDGDFAMNNSGGDSVRLFNKRISAGGILIDSYKYTMDAPENKSFARIPDGIGDWVDPIPTPGKSNILENQQLITNLENGDGDTSVSFSETLESVSTTITGFVLSGEETGASVSAGASAEASVVSSEGSPTVVVPAEIITATLSSGPVLVESQVVAPIEPLEVGPALDVVAELATEPMDPVPLVGASDQTMTLNQEQAKSSEPEVIDAPVQASKLVAPVLELIPAPMPAPTPEAPVLTTE